MVTTTWSMVMMYVAICAGLAGFFIILGWGIMQRGIHKGMKMQSNMVWGLPGMGKVVPLTPWPRHSNIGVLDAQWEYPSAYQQGHTVYFSDPALAYEYVVEAIKQKNLMIDRLENTANRGAQNNYEWLWIDTQIDREYWLEQLKEFREDV